MNNEALETLQAANNPFKPMSDEEFAAALAQAAGQARAEMIGATFTHFLIVHMYRKQVTGEILPHVHFQSLPDFDMALRDKLLGNIGLNFGQKRTVVRTIFYAYPTVITGVSVKQARRAGLTANNKLAGEAISVMGSTLDDRAGMAFILFTRDEERRMIAGETVLLPYGTQPDGREIKLRHNFSSDFWRGYKTGSVAAIAKEQGLIGSPKESNHERKSN